MPQKKVYTFHEEQEIEIIEKVRENLQEFPPYIKTFYRGRDNSMSAKTQLSYCYDLKVFFTFLKQSNPLLKNTAIKDISLDLLEHMELVDFEEYIEYLKYYKDPVTGMQYTNKESGMARKLCSVRSLFAYLYRHNMISRNETAKIEMPSIQDKDIIRLEPDEVAELLDYVETCGENMKPHQKKYYQRTSTRDFAILTLLLGTGMRVSELVSINYDDIDFKNNGVKIIRKGGKEMTVYFSDEVREALDNYLYVRDQVEPVEGHENAIFLSMQRKRISVDAVENMVKKYAKAVTPLKHITPHKLRSTYGSTLYAETGDIYLVADVLGHADVNTTKKHYAAISEDRRRLAGNKVKLRAD